MSDYSLEEAIQGFDAIEWTIRAQIELLYRLKDQSEGEEFTYTAKELSFVVQRLDDIRSGLIYRRSKS